MTGRKNLGRKRCTSNRDDRKLENTVKQSWFKHLWELHKEWTEAGVSASRVTTLRRLQEKGYQATSEPETTSEASYLGCGEKELSGPKPSFQMKVNFAFHLEIKVWSLEEEWRGTESMLLEVQCEVSTVSDDLGPWSAGVGPLCFLKSTVNAAIYQEILEHFMLPSADKLYGDADFLFQQDFSTCPHCQNHFQVLCWPWYYCDWLASQHAWPEPHMESMGYFQEKDEKQSIQQSRRAEGSIVSQ